MSEEFTATATGNNNFKKQRDSNRHAYIRHDNIDNSRRRLICTCSYDGTKYEGWQTQTSGNSIQDKIEAKLKQLFHVNILIAGSGRTDAGVHAKGQTFHFDLPQDPLPAFLNLKEGYTIQDASDVLEKILVGLHENNGLYPTIQICSIRPAKIDNFHARLNCISKRYVYSVCEGVGNPFNNSYYWALGENKILNLNTMCEAAELLIGVHDFSSFGVISETDPRNPIKNMKKLEIRRHTKSRNNNNNTNNNNTYTNDLNTIDHNNADNGIINIDTNDKVNDTNCSSLEEGNIVTITAICDRFLYHMMRLISGTLIMVGLGKLNVNDIKIMLELKGRNKSSGNIAYKAPSRGLCLEYCYYNLNNIDKIDTINVSYKK